MSDRPLTAEQIAELRQWWNKALVINGVEDLVVPTSRFVLELKHEGWWQLLDRGGVVGWCRTLREEGTEPTDEAVADRVSAWYGLPASDAAYAAELYRVGDNDADEERVDGPHDPQLVGPNGAVVVECGCGWRSDTYIGPLTASEAAQQHLQRQGLPRRQLA